MDQGDDERRSLAAASVTEDAELARAWTASTLLQLDDDVEPERTDRRAAILIGGGIGLGVLIALGAVALAAGALDGFLVDALGALVSE